MIIDCHACGARNRVPASRVHQVARCGQCKQAITPLTRPVEMTSADELRALLDESALPVLVDCWAAWCGPCRAVAPELEKLSRAQAGRLVVAKVDTEALPSVAGSLGIRAIPTLILYRGGREAQRVSGAMSAAALAQTFQL